jgi:hypothetical protein
LEAEILNASSVADTLLNVKGSVLNWKGNLDQTDDISLIAIDYSSFKNNLKLSEIAKTPAMEIA